MIDPRQLAPIDTSSPAGATRLLWQARHSLDTANIEAFAATGRWLVPLFLWRLPPPGAQVHQQHR